MESDSKAKVCATCKATAALECGRCKGVHYCNTVCQKANWKEHKKTCNVTELEIAVHRAGTLIQKLFFIWRETTMMEEYHSFVEEGDRLYIYIHGDMPNFVKKVPLGMLDSEPKKKMVLAAQKSSDYVALFSSMLATMLQDFRVVIATVEVELKRPSKAAIVVSRVLGKDRPHDLHEFFQVHSVDKSTKWNLDATGPQYNITTPCMAADQYMSKHGCQVLSSMRADFSSAKYEDYYKLPGLIGLSFRAKHEASTAVERSILSWCESTGVTLSQLLRSDVKEFALLEQLLLAAVEKSMRDYAQAYDRSAEVNELLSNPVILPEVEGRLFLAIDEKWGSARR